jgi:hypothetical protein
MSTKRRSHDIAAMLLFAFLSAACRHGAPGLSGPPVEVATQPSPAAAFAETAKTAADDAGVAAAQEEPTRPYDLLRALTAANSYTAERNAVRVGPSGQTYGGWRIEPDGLIDAAPWMAFDAFERASSGEEAGSVSHAKAGRRQRYRIRDLEEPVLRTGQQAEPPAGPCFAESLIASVDGVLETPDRGAVKGRFLAYGAAGLDSAAEVMFVPTDEKRERWAIVISAGSLSPAGPWLGTSRADLDGDGRSDLAFVAQGVEGCDRGPCPLFWLTLLLTDTAVALPFTEALFIETATADAFLAPCASKEDAFDLIYKLRWKTRIAPRSVTVTATYEACRGEWVFTLLEDGRLVRAPAP